MAQVCGKPRIYKGFYECVNKDTFMLTSVTVA